MRGRESRARSWGKIEVVSKMRGTQTPENLALSLRPRPFFATSFFLCYFALSLLSLPSVEAGPADHLVISEVKAGSGGSDSQDFIELYNPTPVAITLRGMRLVYGGQSGEAPLFEWSNNSTTVIPPKKYFLLGRSGYLPSADANFFSNTNLEFSGGVALVDTASNSYIDAVAWGSILTPYQEGTAAPATGTAGSIERKANNTSTSVRMGSGGVDEFRGNAEDNFENSTDFVFKSVPQPQNSASPSEDGVPPTSISTFSASTGRGGAGGVVDLSWTAVGDDNSIATATLYVVKYSQVPITDTASFNSASTYTQNWTPLTAGSLEKRAMTGLSEDILYYFSIVAVDAAGNSGGLSMNALLNKSVSARSSLPDVTPPASVADAVVTPGSLEGQIALSWSAPGDDGVTGTVDRYVIRYSTSLLSAQNLSLASLYAQAIIPRTPGGREGLLMSGFQGGTVYFFSVSGVDDAGFEGGISNVVSINAQYDVTPPGKIGLLTLSLDERSQEVVVKFTASGDDGTLGTAAGYDIRYSSTLMTTGSASLGTAYVSTLAAASYGQVEVLRMSLRVFTKGVTTYLSVAAKDERGNVGTYPNIVTFVRPLDNTIPNAPVRVRGQTQSDGSWKLTWDAVTFNEDKTPISDLQYYRVYRKHGSSLFVQMAEVSQEILEWTDTSPPAGGAYYFVTALDRAYNESASSLVGSPGGQEGLIRMMDDAVVIELESAQLDDLDRTKNEYREDILLRIVMKAVPAFVRAVSEYEVKASKAQSGTELNGFVFSKRARMAFRLPAIAAAPGRAVAVPRADETYAAFWWDGVNWVKMPGTVDLSSQTLYVTTAKSGVYQIRVTPLATEFGLTTVSPGKVFTPNGDGTNDQVEIFFDNPKDSSISFAKVFDLKGAEVGELKLGSTSASLVWDGKDKGGVVVSRGMYLYQIQVEGKTFTGTVVVAK